MSLVLRFYQLQSTIFNKVSVLNGLPALAFRIYLANVFWMAGTTKWNPFDSESSLENTINWFGNSEWGLGLPFPELLAYLAWGAEYFGAILLVFGLAIRWISIPLIITMLVAIFSVHLQHGWSAIASGANEEISSRMSAAISILKEHGNYGWLKAKGDFVILQNGIEFAFTYLLMLVSLIFTGGGNYLSVDYYLDRYFRKNADVEAS